MRQLRENFCIVPCSTLHVTQHQERLTQNIWLIERVVAKTPGVLSTWTMVTSYSSIVHSDVCIFVFVAARRACDIAGTTQACKSIRVFPTSGWGLYLPVAPWLPSTSLWPVCLELGHGAEWSASAGPRHLCADCTIPT